MIEKIRKADKIAIPMEPMMVLRGNRDKKSAKFRMIPRKESDDKFWAIAKLNEDELQNLMTDAQYTTPLEPK